MGKLVTVIAQELSMKNFVKQEQRYLGSMQYGTREEYQDTTFSLGCLFLTDALLKTGPCDGAIRRTLYVFSATLHLKLVTICSSYVITLGVCGDRSLNGVEYNLRGRGNEY